MRRRSQFGVTIAPLTGEACLATLKLHVDVSGAAYALYWVRSGVHFVVAACENMISGRDGSLRPGDVLVASNAPCDLSTREGRPPFRSTRVSYTCTHIQYVRAP